MEQKLISPPEFVCWESTLKCNFRCKHCGLSAGTARINELTTEEAKEMMVKLNKFGVKNIVISGGEFTVREDWLTLLEFALVEFENVRVVTNGWLGKKFVLLLEMLTNLEKLMISISLDGSEETHDKRRKRGSFGKIKEILETSTPIVKSIITTAANDNFDDLPNILNLCLEHEVAIWSIQISLPAGRMEWGNFLGEKKIRKLADFILEKQGETKGKLIIIPDDCFGYLHPMRERTPWNGWPGCHAGKRLIAILADGSITGCPTLLDWVCGNVRTDVFEEVWHGEKMSKLRDFMLTPPQCQECQLCSGGCKTVQKLFGRPFCF